MKEKKERKALKKTYELKEREGEIEKKGRFEICPRFRK